MPVSYTHLDVYKRQRVCRALPGADEGADHRLPDREAVSAVSYTHLDVYKRQLYLRDPLFIPAHRPFLLPLQ